MRKTVCLKCGGEFTLKGGNASKHEKSCDGSGKKQKEKLINCPFCDIHLLDMSASAIANHVRWCHGNPNRSNYANNCPQLQTVESRRKSREGVLRAHRSGKYTKETSRKIVETRKKNGKNRHTEECKDKLRECALNSPHRRLVRSIRDYIKKDGSIVKLDSSWEEKLAMRLDDLNVEWDRPDPIKWVDKMGRSRNYFPDFYLPEHKIYLDPKNPAAYLQQKEKVEWLKLNRKDVIFLLNLQEILSFVPRSI